MRFAAPWERALKVTTAVATLVLLAALVPVTLLGARLGTTAAAVLVGAVIPATLGLAWGLAPRAFSIRGGRLRIERPLRAIEVPLAGIRAAGPLPDESFRGAVRVAGSGGLFGYYGRFWNRSLGAFRLYATRRTGLVFVDTTDERFVLSPEAPERFVEVLHQRAPVASRSPGAPRPMARRARLGLVLLVASFPLVLGGLLLATWAFSPRAAVIEGGEIRIERALAPPVVIALSDVWRVERVAPEQARFRRVMGTAIPGGARYGRFRSPALGDVQLYAWRAGPYVLLETAGERVVVTPDDADAFVAAARAGLRRRRWPLAARPPRSARRWPGQVKRPSRASPLPSLTDRGAA